MNSETTIAKQMLTPQGRLIATLPQKRRSKVSTECEQAAGQFAAYEVSKRCGHRLTKSGRPHHIWKTAPSTLAAESGVTDTISDGIGRLVQHLQLAHAR